MVITTNQFPIVKSNFSNKDVALDAQKLENSETVDSDDDLNTEAMVIFYPLFEYRRGLSKKRFQ